MLQPGNILHNRYEVIQLLGKGGFGTVYQARDMRLDNIVAIKETFDSDVDFLRQIEREAKMLARLDHPSLTQVIDSFTQGGGFYFVMRYVEGEDLNDYLARQPSKRVTEQEALRIIHPILAALEYLHNQQPSIVHRDIKPSNIRLTPDGRIFLVDFGLAKIYDDPSQQTTKGAQALTPGFAPLEQYGKGITDPRSDLYALGATLYMMLSGIEEMPDAVERAQQDSLPPLRQLNPLVSEYIATCVEKMIAIKADDRYPNVAAVRQALAQPSNTMQPLSATTPAATQPLPPAKLAAAKRLRNTPLILLIAIIIGGILFYVIGTLLYNYTLSLPVTPRPTSTPQPTATPFPTTPLPPTETPTPLSAIGVSPTLAISTTTLPNGIIAFVSQRDGNPEIYTMHTDGTNTMRLTENEANDEAPVWSPDGNRIAFHHSDGDGKSEIYVMNKDGTQITNLTESIYFLIENQHATWSPDGSHLAFQSRRNGNWDIYTINSDGSNEQRLTDNEAFDRYPAWSPDGSRIAFVSNRDRNKADTYDINEEIYVMNADGSNQVNITNSDVPDRAPAWSPDGRFIAFHTYRRSKAVLAIVQVEDSTVTYLEHFDGEAYTPAWSPDGKYLVFASNRDGNAEIYATSLDGAVTFRLTDNPASDVAPDW